MCKVVLPDHGAHGEQAGQSPNGSVRSVLSRIQMLDDARHQDLRRDRYLFFESVRVVHHLVQIGRQSGQCRVHVRGSRNAIGIFGPGLFGIVERQRRQVPTHRKEISLLDVLVAKIANSYGLFEFGTRKREFHPVRAAGIAKDVPAQSAVVTALAHGKEGTAVGTLQPVFVRHLFDREIQGRHRTGKVDVGGSSRVRVLIVSGLFGIRPLDTGLRCSIAVVAAAVAAVSTHASRGSQNPCHGCRSGCAWGTAGCRRVRNRCSLLFYLGTRPLSDLAFVINVKGFSGGRIVHGLPIRGEWFLVFTIVFGCANGGKLRSRTGFFDPPFGRAPLSLACNVICVEHPTTVGIDAFDPTVVHGD
mmetsp:Transcript_19441/g.54164  ORF Transcript_19441/g.54164 Transcript_19441/m.54164 type:complete len:359 (+) Transcript_19441:5964-7040(+)